MNTQSLLVFAGFQGFKANKTRQFIAGYVSLYELKNRKTDPIQIIHTVSPDCRCQSPAGTHGDP